MLVRRPHEFAQTLFAFYDLAVAPITFDFLWFLAGADLCRRRLRLERVHIVVVPGRQGGVRREHDDYEAVISAEARRGRVHNIVIPSCSLLPTCKGVTYAASREQAGFVRAVMSDHIYPSGYEPALPIYPGPAACLEAARQGDRAIACLRAPPERLRDIDRWIATHAKGRHIIAITMRSYGYMRARNSNVDAWVAFARLLDTARFVPVFVPDLDQTLDGLPAALADFLVHPEAAWNIGLRMALYERAFLNISANTGPIGLCWLNARTHYATLKMAVAGVPQTTADYYRVLGFEPGESFPFATHFQELVWEDDNLEAIKRAFARAVSRLDADRATERAEPMV